MDVSRKHIKFIMLFLFVGMLIALLTNGPIIQDPSYHNFSDGGKLFGVPNFWNVVSNFPFILLGIIGLRSVQKSQIGSLHASVLYVGVALVGLGSAYYHLAPTNETLIWDRLPMTLCFMALFSVLLRDYLLVKKDQFVLVVLLVVGLYSIFHWVSYDDLRPYVLVQFFPMLSIPIVLLTQKSIGVASRPFWILLMWYVLAKGAETLDGQIYNLLSIISGHSLKHLFAAIGLFQFYRLTRE